jgi:hypothetical protein
MFYFVDFIKRLFLLDNTINFLFFQKFIGLDLFKLDVNL